MKVLVTYSSRTRNTKSLAEGIFEGLPMEDKVLLPIKEVTSLSEYDIVLVGYWVDKSGPNEEAKNFLTTIKDKKVGLFATLAYWPDTEHAWTSLANGEALVKDNNTVIAKYICQGKLSDKIIEMFEKLPADNPHAVNEEKRKRYEIAKRHPSKADILSAAELFRERLELYVSNEN
ncbi:flavodoxin family protein [Clostridium sp. Marseille-P299]|uniref:flavodoxin family protein n=1 Tax=Clostridium sp. Marseille-P299 TaxID=1805477 RepID=UPI0008298037|nr:flavodoxin family protein [Clostridium sp. Marseille-P299]